MKKNIFIDKTISLYSNLGWKSLFAKIRFWDAPYLEVEELLPKSGNILDLGCGEGLFSNYIALCSPKRKVYGIEVDKKRFGEANRGLKNTKFIYGDVTKIKIPQADVIIMFHLLHHLNSKKDQEYLLSKTKSNLKRWGKLIIVEVEPKISIKFFFAWFTDHFLVPWLFEKKLYSPIYFRKSKEWKTILEKNGFICMIITAEKNMPFSHILFDCKKVN